MTLNLCTPPYCVGTRRQGTDGVGIMLSLSPRHHMVKFNNIKNNEGFSKVLLSDDVESSMMHDA